MRGKLSEWCMACQAFAALHNSLCSNGFVSVNSAEQMKFCTLPDDVKCVAHFAGTGVCWPRMVVMAIV